MRIQIWIKKEDAILGKLDPKTYSSFDPNCAKFVQVSITPDEFAKLEDKENYRSDVNYTYPEFIKKHYIKSVEDNQDANWQGDHWLINQYNRNRNHKDQVKSTKEIPYIFERNPDSGEVTRRKKGDYDGKKEVVTMGLGERFFSTDKELEKLQSEMKEKTGAEFMNWFHKLTKNEQTKLAAFYND